MGVNEYLHVLLRHIHNKELRESIKREYLDHIYDFSEALINQGYSQDEALAKALAEMGNPKEAGMMMNEVYKKKWDWSMAQYMLVIALVFTIGTWLSDYALNLNEVFDSGGTVAPDHILYTIGTVLLIYGFGLSFYEKYVGASLFYANARHWRGNILINSGSCLMIAVLFLVDSPKNTLLLSLTLIFIQLLLRRFLSDVAQTREEAMLYKHGAAAGKIDGYGHIEIDGKRYKAYTNKLIIEDKVPVIVTSMEGFIPIVEPVGELEK